MKKLALIALIVALVVVFLSTDLSQYMTVSGIQQEAERFADWRTQQPVLFGVAFFVFYVAVAALSIPGAAVMTLAAGALFGLLTGLLIVSFASSAGALLAFLVARYLLRDLVQNRFGVRLKAVNAGIEKDGAFYLFTLRMVPVVPFWLINLLMGLTPMPARTFYWVSQVGMFAATAVYVNAGVQLASVDSLSGILSPGLVLSFVGIGILPLLARKTLQIIEHRRVYSAWQKPQNFDRNLVVIGAGAAGLVSAYIASVVKAKVTLVESGPMGGDCLNYGCVPSKTLIRAAALAHQQRNSAEFGVHAPEPEIRFAETIERVHKAIAEIAPHDSVERYTGLGVEVLQGYATITDPWSVSIQCNDGQSRQLTTRSIIIASGASPVVPPIPGIENSGYVTSDTLWQRLSELEEAPAKVAILGGGPIGCELAQALSRLGSRVTIVEMLTTLVSNEDAEASELIRESLSGDGVEILLEHKAVRCEVQRDQKALIVEHAGQSRAIEYDELICAVGRRPRLTGFGLEALGVDSNQRIVANEFLQTRYPNIYACGDVSGSYQFTHTAAHQAWYAAVNSLFGRFKKFRVDNRVIPRVTYTDPEVATVGLTQRDAQEQEIAYEVTRYDLDDLDRAIVDGQKKGFVRVLTVPGKDRILGATIVGAHAGEMLAELTLAMRYNLGLKKVLSTIHPYPTFVEANKYAAGEWSRAHAPEKVLRCLEWFHGRMRGKQ